VGHQVLQLTDLRSLHGCALELRCYAARAARPGRLACAGRLVFIEFLLVRWAGFDPERSLKERRRSLRRAIVLRDRLGLPVATPQERQRARKSHQKIDPLARELDRVEQSLTAAEEPGDARPARTPRTARSKPK